MAWRTVAALTLALSALAPGRASACAIRAQTHIEPTPSGERFLLVLDRRRLKVVSRSGEMLGEAGSDGAVLEAAISPDGKSIAFCPERRGVRVFRLGEPAPIVVEAVGDCSDLSWTQDGSSLAFVLARTESGAAETVAVVQAKLWTVAGGSKTLHVERVQLAAWERASRTEAPAAPLKKEP